ncbi:MAG: cation diffusion facilitator family transporter [bacterium]
MNNTCSEREKTKAASSSVIAAVFLTGIKIVVGIMTGSLGILAEAAHSALDLVAAMITYLSVRVSDKPADREHLYGHGKIENISAFIETLLLLATCVWIIYEAVERLFFKTVHVDISIWAFLVMAISIVVDVSRSRMLYRTARKYNSQALEADALHFSTDVWSSSVVILGLACVLLGKRYGNLAFLDKADSIAALMVAVIVVYVSFKLGARTIRALIDSAPAGLLEQVSSVVERFPEVSDCHKIRVRASGPQVFVDLHIITNKDKTLEQAHALTEEIESAIRSIAPGADVTVHPEPTPDSNDNTT